MKISKLFNRGFIATFCYMFFAMQSAYGDDTEIFFAPEDDTDNIIPNVLFVIDTSGSMNSRPSGSSDSRMTIVKEVMDEVLTDIQNVNVGLMRYNEGDTRGVNSAEGGPILFPATYIDDPADPFVSKVVSNGNNDADEDSATGVVTLDAEFLSLGADANRVSAIRFDNVLVPQGATITSASLVYTANGASANLSTLILEAEKVDDSPVFSTTAFDISNRLANKTVEFQKWVTDSWDSGQPYVSPDMSNVVQEVVDQVNWCGGNALTLLVTGDLPKDVYTIEGSDADSDNDNYYAPAKLKVEYKNSLPAGANGCTALELNSQVSDSDHDWERDAWDNDVSTWNVNWFYYGANAKGTGVSFDNINIPRNAKIVDAYITMTSASDQAANGEVSIKGVDLGNPDPSDYNTLINNASLGPVTWNLTGWTRRDSYETPSLTSLVQDIVDKGDWALGNAMSFYFEGVSGFHEVVDADFDPTLAPKITIFYEATYEPGVVTKREEMKATVADLPASGYTPISDVMAEAGRYFKGDKVYYGIDRDNQRRNLTSHESSFDASGTLVTPAGCSKDNYSASACAAEKITGDPNYISPITDSCQTSHIVFLTDGYPTSHHSATNDIYNEWSGNTCSSSSYGSDCAKKIAGYLANNDQSPTLTGTQKVFTHTIGFDIDFQLLEDMANEGGGSYYTADTKDGLVDAIQSIVADIAAVNTSFVSSGVSVNQYNRLTHNDELYFSLFAPAAGNVWPGNIKRYRLNGNQVVDSADVAAVGTNGEFVQSAQSFWSDLVDGNEVGAGGAAGERGYGRTVYSNISGDDLTWGSNAVRDSNTAITEAMLGAVDADDRTNILDWAQGLDIDALPSLEAHNVIGDPLHSQPILVIYNTASVESPVFETKIYVGTNHGFLHTLDSATGVDEWSFIPQNLLENLSDIQKGSDVAHGYGLDGGIAIHTVDSNNNGVADISDGEKTYLYVGMRRGGSSYFGLDISNPDVPRIMFEISPETSGYGAVSGSTGLGQTWSTPIIKKMNIGGVDNRLVLIFGGGYDAIQDTAGTESKSDGTGNLIYIADALTGAHIWNSRENALQAATPAGSLTDMNGVVGEISALDLDADGLIDTFYASDTKAQIFRFDVNNTDQEITGGKIASLQTASDKENNRRFYYKPDTALIRTTDETFISISIGSGYRAHPLDKNISDNFYMIKDKGGLSGVFDMLVDRSQLVDITSLVGDSDGDGVSDARAEIDSLAARGWYLTFSTEGEKVIERSLTFNNAVLFTTYLPPGSGTNVCEAATGNSRLYALKLLDGNPYVDNLTDGNFTEEDRYIDLTSPGISPPPIAIINDDIRLCIGTDCDKGDLLPPTPDGIMGIRWRRSPN